MLFELKTSQGIRDLPLSESTKELLLKTPESERKGLVYKDSNGNPLKK